MRSSTRVRPRPLDKHFPLYLTTGRLLAHYQSGTQTRRVPELMEAAPKPFAEIHPQVAKRHGIVDGASIVLRTRRGSAIFTSRITGYDPSRHGLHPLSLA